VSFGNDSKSIVLVMATFRSSTKESRIGRLVGLRQADVRLPRDGELNATVAKFTLFGIV